MISRHWCILGLFVTSVGLLSRAGLGADPPLPGMVTKIAFGSCLRQDRPAPILDTITASSPDVFVWLGDNIYGDSDDPAVIKAKYEQLAAIEGFKKLREKVPFLYVWDDHDFGKNDAGREYGFIDQNKQLMLDFFGEPKQSARRTREGNYDAVVIGPEGKRVQFILLDTRSFRSALTIEVRAKKKWTVPNDDPAATLLGEAQWAWLEAQLDKPAEVRIICSSIQVIASQHRFEKWANFPRERERLLTLLNKKTTTHFLILSGDRHHASFHTLDDKVFELTGSSLNQGGTPTPEDISDPAARGGHFGGVNFGWIEIDWAAWPGKTVMQIRDGEGKPVIEGTFTPTVVE
jgi:alkaline phosphatase D